MKLNDELLNSVSGGNRQETEDLKSYLLEKFPEYFPYPDDIDDFELGKCLKDKVPGYRGMVEPGDDSPNGYKTRNGVLNHKEFMDLLHGLFD